MMCVVDVDIPVTGQHAQRPHMLPGRLAGDERLAREAGAGSERAFTTLFQRYHQQLYRYCRGLTGNDQDAQDALQLTFTKALVAMREDRRNAPLRPWLYRIAHNESISVIRSRNTLLLELPEELEGAQGVIDSIEDRERMATLLADLRELPERQRGALVMRELSGLSHEEIAEVLQVSVGAAKQSILEARRSIMEFAEGRAMLCDEIQRIVSDDDRRSLRSLCGVRSGDPSPAVRHAHAVARSACGKLGRAARQDHRGGRLGAWWRRRRSGRRERGQGPRRDIVGQGCRCGRGCGRRDRNRDRRSRRRAAPLDAGEAQLGPASDCRLQAQNFRIRPWVDCWACRLDHAQQLEPSVHWQGARAGGREGRRPRLARPRGDSQGFGSGRPGLGGSAPPWLKPQWLKPQRLGPWRTGRGPGDCRRAGLEPVVRQFDRAHEARGVEHDARQAGEDKPLGRPQGRQSRGRSRQDQADAQQAGQAVGVGGARSDQDDRLREDQDDRLREDQADRLG
jgi:RNA polymerase sigma factor (sigma-70 family)